MFYGKITQLPRGEKIFLFFKSFHGIVLMIGIASLILAFLYKLLWVNIPAKYDWMIGGGEITYNIELSLLASSLFYFVTIYFPNKAKQKKVIPTIEFLLNQLVHIGDEILLDVGGSKEIEKKEFRTKSNSIKMTNTPSRTTLYIMNIGYAKIYKDSSIVPKNWYEYFEQYFEEEMRTIDRLRPYWEYLPEDTIVLLGNIQYKDGCRQAVATYK